jgi:hypothetical protein
MNMQHLHIPKDQYPPPRLPAHVERKWTVRMWRADDPNLAPGVQVYAGSRPYIEGVMDALRRQDDYAVEVQRPWWTLCCTPAGTVNCYIAPKMRRAAMRAEALLEWTALKVQINIGPVLLEGWADAALGLTDAMHLATHMALLASQHPPEEVR